MAFRQRHGQAEPPERVVPVPEEYAGVNFPYRGTEQHGVEANPDIDYDTREFQHEENEPPEYLPEEKEIEPFPVKIVDESARERWAWRSIRYSVGTEPQRMIPRNDRRRTLLIRNRGSNPGSVYLGPDSSVNINTGYILAVGTEISGLVTTEEVWAVSEAGKSPNDIMIIETYAVEL